MSIQNMLEKMDELISHYRESYLSKEKDPGARKMYRGDVDDFKAIRRLIKQKKYEAAARVAQNMDTAPREQIPDDVWHFLENF